ncbi:MAG: RsiV family protein [Eubacteriales bacterium]|nr:RsiV family protein [Eubacteriales bacterium]
MSKNFDDYLRDQLSMEKDELPASVKNKIDETLSKLPENVEEADKNAKVINENNEAGKNGEQDKIVDIELAKDKRKKGSVWKKYGQMAAGVAVVFLFIFPNVSESYARTMEKLPIIGSIVKVVTIRNYFYQDDNHELNVNVPQLEADKESELNKINLDTEELTKKLVDGFYAEMEALGKNSHGSLYVDYEVVTDTENWFTLKLLVNEVKGSSDTYYKYYNVDKKTGNIVKLSDLVTNDEFYDIVEKDIKRQMAERMEKDENEFYWIEEDSLGAKFEGISADHNYYFDKDGNLVIPFDKYEVSPGYMGTPEFTVERALIEEYIFANMNI